MNRSVPHQNTFDIAKKLKAWQTFILIVSTTFTIISILLNSFDKSKATFDIDKTINWINASSSFFAIAFIVFDILINSKFYTGGKEKRLDLIDHAFGTNYSGEKSTGYFNADGVETGVYKLAVHGFENSLFTSEVARNMTFNKWAAALIIATIFIFSACIGNKDLVNNILQIAATGVLIQQAVRLQQFSDRMKNIHGEFKALFNDLKNMTDKTSKEGEMLRNVLSYETTISGGSILTDTKVFNKLNATLSSKWDVMKRDYNIH